MTPVDKPCCRGWAPHSKLDSNNEHVRINLGSKECPSDTKGRKCCKTKHLYLNTPNIFKPCTRGQAPHTKKGHAASPNYVKWARNES